MRLCRGEIQFGVGVFLLAISNIGHADCTSVSSWGVKPYAAGEQVKHRGQYFECKAAPASGWCGLGGAYEPGVGWAWQQAWREITQCANYSVVDCAGLSKWQSRPFASGERVAHNGMAFQCKSYPFNGWCGQSPYEPRNSVNWPDAWQVQGICSSDNSARFVSNYFAHDNEALAVLQGNSSVTLPTIPHIEDLGLQWRVTNAMRMLGKEPRQIATGEAVDASVIRDLDRRVAEREQVFARDAAQWPDYQQIWAPDFRDNMPQTMAVHIVARSFQLMNAGPRKFQRLNNQCLLANLVPAFCGALADFGTVDASWCRSGAPMRARQVVQFPDFFSFNNVRSEITANELPVLGSSIASSCGMAATGIHEFTHDIDWVFKNGGMNDHYDRVAACGNEWMDFVSADSPFVNGAAYDSPRDFVSNYAGGFNDGGRFHSAAEQAAETVTAYILFPQYFRERAARSPYLQMQYNFIKQRMFGGVEFKNAALDHQVLVEQQPATMPSLCFEVNEFRMDDVMTK